MWLHLLIWHSKDLTLVEGQFFKLHKDDYLAPVKGSNAVPISNALF